MGWPASHASASFDKLTAAVVMKLSLSPETERLIEQKVSSGRYQSADEVVRESLKLLEERDNGSQRAAPEKDESSQDQKKPTTLYELFEPIWKMVPDSEWEKLPRDLAANHEHYLYGSKKQW